MMETVRLQRTPSTVRLLRVDTDLHVTRSAQTVRVIATGTGVPGPPGPQGPTGPPIDVTFGPTPPPSPSEGDLWIQTT